MALQQTIEQEKDTATRDICSVSVAPASKSEVRRILDTFAKNIVRAVINEIEGMSIWTANNTPKDPQAIKDDLLSKLQEVL